MNNNGLVDSRTSTVGGAYILVSKGGLLAPLQGVFWGGGGDPYSRGTRGVRGKE